MPSDCSVLKNDVKSVQVSQSVAKTKDPVLRVWEHGLQKAVFLYYI